MKRILAILLFLACGAAFAQQRVTIVGDQSGGAGTGPFTNIKTDTNGNLFVTGGSTAPPTGVTYTQLNKTVTNSSASLLASNASRKYLQVQNFDASGIIYVRCDGNAATTTTSVVITAGETWAPLIPPVGACAAIGSIASNANVATTEGQ